MWNAEQYRAAAAQMLHDQVLAPEFDVPDDSAITLLPGGTAAWVQCWVLVTGPKH